jgi:two-component system chemotaxis response regulator CheB
MGRDGAKGLLRLARLGAMTLAQDEASCAVYGMPGEAVRLGAVRHQSTPAEIARRLVRWTREGRNPAA